jgi:hypothetical protein
LSYTDKKRSIGEYAEVDNQVQDTITIYDGEKEIDLPATNTAYRRDDGTVKTKIEANM